MLMQGRKERVQPGLQMQARQPSPAFQPKYPGGKPLVVAEEEWTVVETKGSRISHQQEPLHPMGDTQRERRRAKGLPRRKGSLRIRQPAMAPKGAIIPSLPVPRVGHLLIPYGSRTSFFSRPISSKACMRFNSP